MEMGEIIRENRKRKHMTQEEMANRLGVTAPAVNKWENGNSFPDIMLLAPIARLLGISTDTLLSYQESLTDEEVEKLLTEARARFKEGPFHEAFQWTKEKMECYPNCEHLILWMAQLMDGLRLFSDIPDQEKYDDYINRCYCRVLESREEDMRTAAAESLFSFYLRKEQFDKAEECLSYFPLQDPERKRKQADIYRRTNRPAEAYRAYEELLFHAYQLINVSLYQIYRMALDAQDKEKARFLAEKLEILAKLFDMGEYREISPRLELAVLEQDAEQTLDLMERMLASFDSLYAFRQSPLYEHIDFREPQENFLSLSDFRKNLLESFRDEKTYGFLSGNERWDKLS